MFTLYHADCIGQAGNCLYPHKVEITDNDSLERAVSRDYVCAEYERSYRSNDNFIGSDCLSVECDNDHSDNPADWKTPDDIADAFPGVEFAVHYSRNHMKMKNGRAARPKFHAFFAIDHITDAEEYASLKRLLSAIFPYFDICPHICGEQTRLFSSYITALGGSFWTAFLRVHPITA